MCGNEFCYGAILIIIVEIAKAELSDMYIYFTNNNYFQLVLGSVVTFEDSINPGSHWLTESIRFDLSKPKWNYQYWFIYWNELNESEMYRVVHGSALYQKPKLTKIEKVK